MLTSQMVGGYEVTDSLPHGATVFEKFQPITGLHEKFRLNIGLPPTLEVNMKMKNI